MTIIIVVSKQQQLGKMNELRSTQMMDAPRDERNVII